MTSPIDSEFWFESDTGAMPRVRFV